MTQLGKYTLHETLGHGSFGTVYRAYDSVLEVERAVKILHPALLTDPDFIERFRREGRLAARLDHPNIVPVYDLDEADGYFFLAMKFMPGGSLKDLLEKSGPLPYPRAVELLTQVAAGLDYAHNQGIIHRDIKPANILLEANGAPRVADFGFARAMSGGGAASLSGSGGLVGTPAYIAPELWRNKPAIPACDVYSLGCVFYEMVTGKVLFDGDSLGEVMTHHILDGPNLPAHWPEGTPPGITALLERALAQKPEDRYQTAGAFIQAAREIDRLVDSQPVADPVMVAKEEPVQVSRLDHASAKHSAAPAVQNQTPVPAASRIEKNSKQSENRPAQKADFIPPAAQLIKPAEAVALPPKPGKKKFLLMGGILVVVCIVVSLAGISLWNNMGNDSPTPTQPIAGIQATDRTISTPTIAPTQSQPTLAPAEDSRIVPAPPPGILTWIGRNTHPAAPNNPLSVAVDSQGNVYLADSSNQRIQVFNAQGKILRVIEGFDNPIKVRVDEQDRLYVIDFHGSSQSSLVRINVAGTREEMGTNNTILDVLIGQGRWGILYGDKLIWESLNGEKLGEVTLQWGDQVTVGPQNHLYVMRFDNTASAYLLLELDEAGLLVRTVVDAPKGKELFHSVSALTVDAKGWIYIIDGLNHTYIILNPEGEVQYNNNSNSWMPYDNPKYAPADISVDQQGFLYTAHPYNNRARKFDKQGQLVTEFGVGSHSAGELLGPDEIAIYQGRVYVCDSLNARIQVFDLEGKFLQQAPLGDLSQFINPQKIAITQDGHIYILSNTQGFAVIFELDVDLQIVQQISTNIQYASGLEAGPDGNLYLPDDFNEQMVQISPSGSELARWNTGRADAFGIAPNGSIWVAIQQTVKQYSITGQEQKSIALTNLPEGIFVDGALGGTLIILPDGSWYGSNGYQVLHFNTQGQVVGQWSLPYVNMAGILIRAYLQADGNDYLFVGNPIENYVFKIKAP